MEGFATGSVSTALAFTLIATVLLKATILLGVVAGAAWGARKTAAATQHAIWRMGMIGLLLLPVLALTLPAVRIPLPAYEWLAMPQSEETGLEAASGVSSAAPVGAVSPGLPLPVERNDHVPEPKSQEVAPAPRPATEVLAAGLLALWGLGVMVVVGRWMTGLWQVCHVTRAACPERSSRRREVQYLSRRLGLRRPVRLLYSEAVRMPAHWGLWRPTVLLPAAAAQWDADRFRIVLLHELAHAKRWDYATHIAASLVRAIYWFNPFVWWAGRRMNLLQERACDDVVLRAGTHAHVYATQLLELARALQAGQALPAAVAMAQAPTLKDRVRAILDRRDRAPRSAKATWLALVGAGIVGLPLAALRPGGPLPPVEAQTIEVVGPSEGNPLPEATPREQPDEAAAPAGPVYLWFEAEAARLQAPFEVRDDVRASGTRFAFVPDGEGNDAPEGGAGSATFSFDVVRPGVYQGWGRVIGDGGNDNSFYVSADEGPEVRWDILDESGRARVRQWQWLPVVAEATGTPVTYAFEAGPHTLRIRNREDGTRLDQLLLTNDLSYRPRGAQPLRPPRRPVYVWMEAEAVRLTEPLRIRRDEAAGEGGFIAVARGHDSRKDPPRDGRAAFRFDVDEPGRYTVWGRVAAPDGDKDSFWVRMDGGAWVRWNGIRRGNGWRWDEVHDSDYGNTAVSFLLEGGAHTLEVAYREAGTRLDKVLVTNDPGFVPQGWGDAQRTVEVRFRTAP